MIGGVITSAVLNLLIYPVIYVIWRKRSLPPLAPRGLPAGPSVPESGVVLHGSRRRVLAGSIAVLLIGAVIGTAYLFWPSGLDNSPVKSADPAMPVAKITQDGATVSILSADGKIHAKDNALQIEFQDQRGHPVDAENVKLNLNMDMPGMEMNAGAAVSSSGSPGLYQIKVKPSVAGDWNAKVSWQGPNGQEQAMIPVTVKP
jgi:YtkA-like protein